MKSPGFPPAKNVEQAILLAQLLILREMEKTRKHRNAHDEGAKVRG